MHRGTKKINLERLGELTIEVILECISVDRIDAPSSAGRHKRQPMIKRTKTPRSVHGVEVDKRARQTAKTLRWLGYMLLLLLSTDYGMIARA